MAFILPTSRHRASRHVPLCSQPPPPKAHLDPPSSHSPPLTVLSQGKTHTQNCSLRIGSVMSSCTHSLSIVEVGPELAFSGACRSRPTLYRAEHHTPMGRVLRSYALEPSRGVVRLLHMCCPSSTSLLLSCFFSVHLEGFFSLVLSCLVSLECTFGGLFMAHALAGLHCTVLSITPPSCLVLFL
jgi:hypothetical protein